MINPFYYSVGTRVRDTIFLDMFNIKKGDTILDVGCGLGYFTDLMSRQGASCVGIDLDKECIDYCQKNMQGDYQLCDINKLPFPDKTFDKVLCTEVLEHINHNGVVLDEIRRVVKDNGIIIVTTPCSSGMFGAFFKRIGHSSVDGNSREYHWHKGYTERELYKLLDKYDICPLRTEYTLVALTEIFMGITKIMVRAMRLKKIDSQANALDVEKTLIWKIYCKLFPAVLAMARAEQPLSKKLKGHMIVVKGIAR